MHRLLLLMHAPRIQRIEKAKKLLEKQIEEIENKKDSLDQLRNQTFTV